MATVMRQELADFGSPGDMSELTGDERLFRALVSGCHVENAARLAGLSTRTAYRRLADPEFRSRLNAARQDLRESILARLAEAGHDAVDTLWTLLQESEDESIRLRAARAVLESLMAFHGLAPRVETTVTSRVEHSQRIVS
jgi:HEAT repeat protein